VDAKKEANTEFNTMLPDVFDVMFSSAMVSPAIAGVMIVSQTIPSSARGWIVNVLVSPTLPTTNASCGVPPVLVNTDAPKVTWYVPAFAIFNWKGDVAVYVRPVPDGVLTKLVNGTLVLLVTVVPEALPRRYK